MGLGGIGRRTIVSSGGFEVASSGGIASGARILSGATEALWSGGGDHGTVVSKGATLDLAGIILSGGQSLTVQGRRRHRISGGRLSASLAEPKSEIDVLSGGLALGDMLEGAYIFVGSLISGVVMAVSSGGLASGTLIAATAG